MKRSFVPSLVFLALGYALVAQVAVHASVSALNLPVLFGVLFGSSLLVLAFGDYSRKPRFRGYGRRSSSAPPTAPATSSDVEPAAAWTYTTFSA